MTDQTVTISVYDSVKDVFTPVFSAEGFGGAYDQAWREEANGNLEASESGKTLYYRIRTENCRYGWMKLHELLYVLHRKSVDVGTYY